jgi:uncharacterized protein YtpQ (UPF0354 family)
MQDRRLELACWLLVASALSACGAQRGAAIASAPTTPRAPPPAPTTKLDEVPFADRVQARIRQLAPLARIEQTAAHGLRVWPKPNEPGTEGGLQVFLDNLERSCDAAPSTCDALIDDFVRSLLNNPASALTLEQVLPTLKSQAFVEETQRFLSKDDSVSLLASPIVDDLRMVLVLDSPRTTRFLNTADLEQLHMSAEDLRARALANLGKAHPLLLIEIRAGLFGLGAGDGYDSAIFLMHDAWRAVQQRLGGNVIVAPVARDMVFVTSDREPQALAALAKALADEQQHPHVPYPITTRAYRWTQTGWARFDFDE